MDFNRIKAFLESFNISEEKINNILKGKSLLKKNNNYYLVSKPFLKKQIHGETLIYIQLKDKLLPSKYFLRIIQNNTQNILDLTSNKKALQFTFSKDIEIPETIKEENYIITFNSNIIGVGKGKQNKIISVMNVGEYLKES